MTGELPKTVEGKITNIQHLARTFEFRPNNGFGVTVQWAEPQDELMSKYKQNYKAKVTYEPGKGGNWLTEIISLYKKNDGGGFGKGQQKDERLILIEVIYKEVSQTARSTIILPDSTFMKEQFVEVQDAVVESTIEHYQKLINAVMGEQK